MSEKDLERMDEMEIDIKDFFMYICLQWRMFLIWILIGAVMLGGIGAWKAYCNNHAARQEMEMSSEESEQSRKKTIEELKQSLTSQEAMEVEHVFNSYKDMVRNCESVIKYVRESIRMQLDPYAVPMISLGYYIDNHYESVYPAVEGKDNTAAIITALQEGALDTVTYKKILQELGWEKDEEYVRELISTWNVGDVVYISIFAPKQDECETIRNVIMERIQIRSKELQDVFGEFDAEMVENEYRVVINTALLSEQVSMDSNIYNYRNNYASLEAGLSESQKGYLNELKNMELQISTQKDGVQDKRVELSEQNLFQKKYVLLGMLAGVFLYAFYLFLRYASSEKLHTVSEMERRYQVRVLAEIDDIKAVRKKNVIDRIFYRLFIRNKVIQNVGEAVRVIQSEIRVWVKNTDMSSIYIASTCNMTKYSEIIESIYKRSDNVSYDIYVGNEIGNNPEELEKMGSCGGVVFIEQIGVSSYKEIRRLICFCHQNNIPIIGCAVVR